LGGGKDLTSNNLDAVRPSEKKLKWFCDGGGSTVRDDSSHVTVHETAANDSSKYNQINEGGKEISITF
jgi:hypothetical protein